MLDGAFVFAGFNAGGLTPLAFLGIHVGNEWRQFHAAFAEQRTHLGGSGRGCRKRFLDVHRPLGGASQHHTVHGSLHRAQLGVHFEQEAIAAARDLEHVDQLIAGARLHANGQDDQVNAEFDFFPIGEQVLDPHQDWIFVTAFSRRNLRALLAGITQEAHAVFESVVIKFFVAAPIGTDVLMQVINCQAGETLVQLTAGLQGCRTTHPRAVIVDLAVFVRLVDAFQLAAAHAVDKRQRAHGLPIPLERVTALLH